MFIYNIGYDNYEDSRHVQFVHEEKFNDEELENMVQKAVIRALEYAIDPNKKKSNEFYFSEEGISFEELFPRIIVELKKFGFREVRFCGEFRVVGYESICIDHEDRGVLTKLINSIPKSLKDRVIEKGKKK